MEVVVQVGIVYVGMINVSVWGDFDNDGYFDFYLGNWDEFNILYCNNGDGIFIDISVSVGVNFGYCIWVVFWGDVDWDGYVDLYVVNFVVFNYLYYNNGDGIFMDIIVVVNVQDFGIVMGFLFFDYDNDGDFDFYFIYDVNQFNILYCNDGIGYFEDVLVFVGANIVVQGMGVDFVDINYDGFFDFYIINLYENVLLFSDGDGIFMEIGSLAGVDDLGMGWGMVFLDYDNDGYSDIYVFNDIYFVLFDNLLYCNLGNMIFEVVSEGIFLLSLMVGYGVVMGDVNFDGKLDLLFVNVGFQDGNQFFLNSIENGYYFVKVCLWGMESNVVVIGVWVMVEVNGQV